MTKCTAALALLLSASSARAEEVVQLIDGTKIVGVLHHYYDGVVSVMVGGEEMKIPKEKVKSIGFSLPAPRPELGTPEKTFERWRQALMKGDLPTVVDSYALMYQGMLAQQLDGGGEEDLKKMREEMKTTKFAVRASQQKGETATLKVERKKGDDVETAELRFVRENGEWKMTP